MEEKTAKICPCCGNNIFLTEEVCNSKTYLVPFCKFCGTRNFNEFAPIELIKNVKLKVFLGGTCNGSIWRENLIKLLKIDYYNPVVENWTLDHMEEEIRQREECDYCLYVITPKMTGVYAIAELIDDSNKRPEKTIFCYYDDDVTDKDTFSTMQIRSLERVGNMVEKNGGKWFYNLDEVAKYLNNFSK